MMAARKVVLVGLLMVAVLVCVRQAAPMQEPVTMTMTMHAYTYAPVRDGGYGDAQPGDEFSQKLANSVKDDILKQARLGFTPAEFVVEKYKTQVVAGYNTSLKIRVAPGKYIHTEIYTPLTGEASPKSTVSRVQANKTLQDAL